MFCLCYEDGIAFNVCFSFGDQVYKGKEYILLWRRVFVWAHQRAETVKVSLLLSKKDGPEIVLHSSCHCRFRLRLP